MPRTSERAKAIAHQEAVVHSLHQRHLYNIAFSDNDSDSFDEVNYHLQQSILKRMQSSRFLFRSKKYRKRTIFDFEDALSAESNEYNDDEFLFLFRIRRASFFNLLDMIKDDPIFNKKKYKKARPSSHQLLVFLYRIGREGVAASLSALSAFFKLGKGTLRTYILNVLKAIIKHKQDVIYWPSAEERKELSDRLTAYGFPNCVGIIDGTLIVLDRRPATDFESYYSRKSNYAINCAVVCDDNCRIIYYLAGWPGSTHDNRVLRNSDLYQNKSKYFSINEYLLGDSAYSASQIMVQAFKKGKGEVDLPPRKEQFNTILAEVRIKSEHCIGILKARFPSMRRLNVWIKKGKKQVKHIVELITACMIIHNLMIDYDDLIPQEWYDEFLATINWDIYDEEYSSDEDVDHTKGNDQGIDRRKFAFKHVQQYHI